MLLPKNTNAFVHIQIDGVSKSVSPTTTVAAILATFPRRRTRISAVLQEDRAPFCGMGICQECRVTINGKRRLSCQTLCQEGMIIETLQA